MRNVLFACILIGIAGACLWYFSPTHPILGSTIRIQPSSYTLPVGSKNTDVPDLSASYKQNTYRFSFGVPEGYTVREVNDEETVTVLIENTTGDGIQIVIAPFDENLQNLTKERIMNDIPDMMMSEPQEVAIGDRHKGIAFLSDNEAFGGASREVWFVFRGHLYQISTYARLDPLLQALFGTWQFL